MKFQTETVRALTELGDNDVEGNLIRYADEPFGRWRWGHVRRIVFGPNEEGGGKFAFEYRESSGDGDWIEWDDCDDEIEAYPVLAVARTTISYERI